MYTCYPLAPLNKYHAPIGRGTVGRRSEKKTPRDRDRD